MHGTTSNCEYLLLTVPIKTDISEVNDEISKIKKDIGYKLLQNNSFENRQWTTDTRMSKVVVLVLSMHSALLRSENSQVSSLTYSKKYF